jgi:hypothetical protein
VTSVIERDAGSRTRRRRSRRRRTFLAVLLALLLAAVASYGGYVFVTSKNTSKAAPKTPAGKAPQRTVLVTMTLHDDPMQRADSFTLFATGRAPVVLFAPARTLGQIPGQTGFEAIGLAASPADPVLLPTLTFENLTGIRVDDTHVVSDVTIGRFVEALGGIDVDVAEHITEDSGNGPEQIFPLGAQHMDGATAVDYMTYRSDTETEMKRFVRAQKVWDAILAKDSTTIANAFRTAADGDVEAADLAELAAGLEGVSGAAERAFEVLPVTTVQSGGKDEAYNVDARALDEMAQREFSGALTGDTKPSERPKIELRNGVGSPGLGEKAARSLVPAGMKIEVAGNTDGFGKGNTRIIVYRDDEAARALGQKIRVALGTGLVSVGVSSQTVVDVTVVLGPDFARR